MNELDRAMLAVQRSRASTPEFYRQLATGELWFLLPFHPEMEGAHFEIKNGTTLPFVMLMDAAGEIVPLFSSEARLEEGLKAGRLVYLGTDPVAHELGSGESSELGVAIAALERTLGDGSGA